MANGETLKATVLLERYPGDERWFAKALAAPTCVAEGLTPEEATANVIEEMKYQAANPEVATALRAKPEYLLTEVEVLLPTAPPTNAHSS